VTRYIIKKVLRLSQIEVDEVVEAENGYEGLEKVEEQEFSFIVLDLNMPEMGGTEFLRRLRANITTKDIPVIAVSTESNGTTVKVIKRLNATYVHKPIPLEMLRDKMLKFLKEESIINEDYLLT
jgi:two-component system chemotaxis response regulator CheY